MILKHNKLVEIDLTKMGNVHQSFGDTIMKESLDNIHTEGYRLRTEDYIDLLKKQPELYEDFPDDIKCQELELAAKIS